MNNYEDQYERLHHKPVTNADQIPSNNGWIYTAYFYKLKNIKPNRSKVGLKLAGEFCAKKLHRHPYYLRPLAPPISRDEILGLAYLGFLKLEYIKGWNFSPKPIPRFNPIKLVKQLLEVKGKHRNYFWENNLDQMYRFAYSVPLTDRHFILKQQGEFNLFYWAIAKVDSMSSKRSGIRWLKYGKGLEEMKEEFPEDHPIRKDLTTSHQIV
jgi:hypothetical protein